MNITCIICSELFISGADIYFTQCGHVFHFHCIINWLERSKSCPQCRTKVTEKSMHKVFFNIASTEANVDATTLMYKLDTANFNLSIKEKEISNLNQKKRQLKEQNKLLRQEVLKLEKDEKTMESTLQAFKEQIVYFKTKSKESDKLSNEIVKLKTKIKDMENLEAVINGNREQVTNILREEHNIESLALLAATLKKALLDSEKVARDRDYNLKKAKNELSKQRKEYALLEAQNADLRRDLQQIKMKTEKEKNIMKQRMQAIKSSSKSNNIVVANPEADSDNSDVLIIDDDLPHHSSHQDTSLPNMTLSVNERVEDIINSDSPYLPVKTNFGSFLNTKFQAPNSNTSTKPATSPIKKGYSIFKTNQKQLVDFNKGNKSSGVAYDGLGGSSKEDIFPTSKKPQTGMKRIKSSSSISSSKFRKLAPISSTTNTPRVTEFFKTSE